MMPAPAAVARGPAIATATTAASTALRRDSRSPRPGAAGTIQASPASPEPSPPARPTAVPPSAIAPPTRRPRLGSNSRATVTPPTVASPNPVIVPFLTHLGRFLRRADHDHPR